MSLASNQSGLLWIMLRSLATATAKHHARLIDTVSLADRFADAEPAVERHGDLSRVPLSTPSLASGVFVASPFEEDAERWDGLA